MEQALGAHRTQNALRAADAPAEPPRAAAVAAGQESAHSGATLPALRQAGAVARPGPLCSVRLRQAGLLPDQPVRIRVQLLEGNLPDGLVQRRVHCAVSRRCSCWDGPSICRQWAAGQDS